MKQLSIFFSSDLNWTEHYAKEFEGKIEGNFIRIPESVQVGNRYFLECDKGLVSFFIDVAYKKSLQIDNKNLSKDFVSIYYNLTEGDAVLSCEEDASDIGRWESNMTIVDSEIETSYVVKEGSSSFVFCIYVNKSNIISCLQNKFCDFEIERILSDLKSNIKFWRMKPNDYWHLNELRKLEVGSKAFDFALMGATHILFSGFIDELIKKNESVVYSDNSELQLIISIQKYLVDNIMLPFPGNDILAKKVFMSESKFKKMFKKITGCTPYHFYMSNKLYKAKELLDQNELSIKQISVFLNFCDSSYFVRKFKDFFGASPGKYIVSK